jgi:hypothetical protein
LLELDAVPREFCFLKTIVSPSQQALFDPFEGVLGPMGRRMIDKGWQGLFREALLEQMPVAQLSKQLKDDGRPTFELHAIIALLLIREFQGWTVPQTHEALLFRADIQYALNLQPGIEVTQRTIERYIARVQNDEVISEEIFSQVTDTLLRSMEVKVHKQRLDSTHVLSDMSTMGRAQMIGVTLRRFFHKLEKHDAQSGQPALLERFDQELLKRYRKQSDSRIFGDARTTELRKVALQQAAEDLCLVLSELGQTKPVCDWQQFKQMQTIFSQQCEVREEFVEVRKKTGGHVIVNPSDPDATYSGHKGAGHQVQIAETFNDEGLPNFITSAQVETAADNDADAPAKVIDDLSGRDLLPEELLADTAYGGDANVQSAKEKGVDLIAPVPGAKKHNAEEIGYDQFQLNEAGEVEYCPAGHAPKSTNYNSEQDYTFAQMNAETCAGCPLLERCRVQRNKKTRAPTGRIQFTPATVRSETRRRHEQSDEFREKYRWRSGIEGTNGCLKRRLGLGRLRVRGRRAVKLSILLKLAGWNVLRAVAMRNVRSENQQLAAV